MLLKTALRPFNQRSGGAAIEDGAVEEPQTVSEGMDPVDLAAFGGEPERLGADLEKRGCIGEVEPGFDAIQLPALRRPRSLCDRFAE
jgi:hypothetical protein